MAQRRINYSVQLPDIQAPQKGQAGELARQAALTRGRAEAVKTDANTGLISFLGTTAVEGYKGALLAGLSKDIDSTLDKLEGVGEEAIRAEAQLERLRSQEFAAGVADQLTLLREQSGMDEPQLVKDFMADISRYAEAQRQGTLSRSEVVARIAADVKRYSALMPGWASDFRRMAAEKTGISNIDVYGIHQALTQKSLREKAVEKQMEYQMALDKEIASEHGLRIDQITPQVRAFHHQSKQLKLAAQNAENQVKMQNIGRDEADRAYGQIIDMKIAAATADLGKEFTLLGELHGDPTKADAAAQASLRLVGKITMMGQQLEQEIRAMTRPEAGKTPLSVAEAERRIEAVRKNVKELIDGVKNVEGRNMLSAMAKNSQGRLEQFLANFQMANSYLAGLNKLGLIPSGVAQAWLTLTPEEFRKRFGDQMFNAFQQVTRYPQAHAQLMVNAALGQSVDLPAIAAADPGLATVAAADMLKNLEEWAAAPNPTPQVLNAYANTFANSFGNSRNFNPNVPKNVDAAYKLLSSSATQAMLGKLSTEQRQAALLPLIRGIEQTVAGNGAAVLDAINQWNDEDTNVAARHGVKLRLSINPLSGMLELTEERQDVPIRPFLETEGGAAYGMRTAPVTAASRLNARSARARAEELIRLVNKQVETFTLAVRALNPELGTKVTDVRQRAYEMISRGVGMPLVPGLLEDQADVPRNEEPDDLDPIRVQEAIIAAERSDVNDGLSPAGALGPFQFMPETAKQYGLKIDPDAGIDERRDRVKAGEAAVRYISDLRKVFKGDMEKVAAAYNAGQGNVMNAVKKATELGVPEDWKSFLPKPEETVPYIRRFMNKWTIKPIIQAQR